MSSEAGGLVPAKPANDSLCALKRGLSPPGASVSPDVNKGGKRELLRDVVPV